MEHRMECRHVVKEKLHLSYGKMHPRAFGREIRPYFSKYIYIKNKFYMLENVIKKMSQFIEFYCSASNLSV